MSATPVNRIKLLATAGLSAVVVVLILALVWANRNAGSLAVVTTLMRGAGIDEIGYRVTGNGISALDGKVTVSDPSSPTSFSVDNLPPGIGYAIELWATSSNGGVKCGSRGTFDVMAKKTTSLTLSVHCRDMSAIIAFMQARKASAQRGSARAAAQPAPPIEVPPECSACQRKHIESGECEPDSGCDGLNGEDKQLCMNLLNCMRATNCWTKDPLDCLCGTVNYVECIKGGNGACLAEMQAATKTTDPIKNGTLFYDPTVPAGRANRLISCDKEKCASSCAL